MTLDKFVEGDIVSTCNALGSEIQGVYEKGSYCVECLKDILRYLKRDNDDHSVLLFLGSIRLPQTDLLPLIKRYDKDDEIFDLTLRILVALTNPALLLFKEDVPDDKLSRNVYLQINSYLQCYKKAFIDSDLWKIFCEHLKTLLKVRPIERNDNEKLFIERIIILIRNILHVSPDESICKQTEDDDSPHDKILQCLHESKINILLLYMCANEEEHKYCLHILEIISLMFCEHTTETLASANETRSINEKESDLKALLVARQREQDLKSQKIQSFSASRFKGVYRIKNMKSLSENDYIAHKFISSPSDIKFDLQKDYKRKPKNRVRAPDVDNTRKSSLNTRLFLKKFCIEFLKTYNKMMTSVKRELLRKVSDDHDDSYYLWAVCYFMQFNRLYDFQPALVSETISIQSFHHIQTQITNYQEMMLTDKKKAMFWSKRMQLGVSAYKELLETLKMMEKSHDEIIRECADALISHVFYVIEYREMLLSLLSNYDEVKFSLSYLAKLVESVQLFLKMLENHSKKHSEIVVQKKQKKIPRKKKKIVPSNEPINEEDQLNDQWDAVVSELSGGINGNHTIPVDTPFDGASEISFEEQKVEAIYKIRESLIANEPLKALALLRAARELWPEGDSFGASDIEPEAELLVIKEIHFSGLQRNPSENPQVEIQENYSDEEDEEIESLPAVSEQQLNIDEVYRKYATPKVVHPCSLLLANYQNNRPQTNVCLIKLLHRIAWNCKMHALFFQSTIFLTFQKIFHDPDIKYNPVIKEFYRFAKFILQKFFAVAQKNKKIFIEILFWKGSREAYELEEGYDASESKVKGWTEDEDEELKYIYDENKDIYIEGQDVADIILANLDTKKRTKPQIIAALKRLGLIKSVNDLKPEKRKEWQEVEIVELQHLFEDYKGSDDIMSIILDKLSIKRSRKAVTEKLLELNLIADRKELRKKTSKKRKERSENNDSNGNSSDEDSKEESDFDHDKNFNSESSGEEDEINFFKNLDAERYADENSSLPDENNGSKKSSDSSDTRKKISHVWEEQEIMELTSLFHENSESSNVMEVILDSLSVKHPKKAVIEKLLELGLIKDKKEIKKKKHAKKIDVNNFTRNDTDILDDENKNSESELDSFMNEKMGKESNKRKKLKHRIVSDSSDEDSHKSAEKIVNKTVDKKKVSKEWKEEEIIQLNHLFLEYKDSEGTVSNIFKNLSVKRAKKNIIEKMLEIGLIKDKTEFEAKKNVNKASSSKQKSGEIPLKPKRKKPSDLWQEQEIIKLNQLYQNHKDSNDIMSNVLTGLSVKRNKQVVVQKMLEIGLIHDKKEIRKRRISKKVKTKQNSHKLTDSEDEDSKNRSFNCISSDDESVPLGSIISTSQKNHVEKSVISASQSNSETVVSSSVQPSNEANLCLSDSVPHEIDTDKASDNDDLSGKNNKRKTFLLITSDESSGQDDAVVAEELQTNVNLSDVLDTAAQEIDSEKASDNYELSVRSNKRKRLLITSDESSGEDDAVVAEELQTNVNLSDVLDTAAQEMNSEKASDNYELSVRSNKRKRLLITSDESSEEDDANVAEESRNSLDENNIVNVPKKSQDSTFLKKQKKKICVLEDSDESS